MGKPATRCTLEENNLNTMKVKPNRNFSKQYPSRLSMRELEIVDWYARSQESQANILKKYG
jgi:hypothetical protein